LVCESVVALVTHYKWLGFLDEEKFDLDLQESPIVSKVKEKQPASSWSTEETSFNSQ